MTNMDVRAKARAARRAAEVLRRALTIVRIVSGARITIAT